MSTQSAIQHGGAFMSQYMKPCMLIIAQLVGLSQKVRAHMIPQTQIVLRAQKRKIVMKKTIMMMNMYLHILETTMMTGGNRQWVFR
eukprot:274912-Karenia_brevis.AAC.1